VLPGTTDNLDFLAARLHGRRSRMAKGEELDALCRLRGMAQLAAAVSAGVETDSATEVQRSLVQDLAWDVADLVAQLPSAGAELLRWLVVRFQVENLKVLLRGLLAGLSLKSLRPHLIELPREFKIDVDSLGGAKSVAEFRSLLPRGPLRESLGRMARFRPEEKRPFFFEAALDRGYFEELLARAEALFGDDKELAKPLLLQEADTFHLMLVARGKFVHRLEVEALLPLHVARTGIARERFAAMLADADLRTAANRTLGRALDTLPPAPGEGGAVDPSGLEALAWNRFQRLANRAFRRSHTGLAAVVAFVELQRVEVANLITLSEGIRAQLPEEQVRARLTPRRTLEVARA
jgi:V/A-type H+-transporting ATPase subunit C